VVLRIVSRGLSPESYQELRERLDIDRRHPLGMIMHGATVTDGIVWVAQVWESADYASRWDEEKLLPALEALGLPLESDVKVFELDHLVTP
jgi:3-dehydroquinate synthetase